MSMRKVIAIFLIVAVAAAAAWLILLRPSDYTEENLIADFNKRQSSFITVAEYLVENNVTTTIDGFLTIDNGGFGVPTLNGNKYRAFNDANTVIMKEKVNQIVAYGDRVEFRYLDEGGFLNRINARIVYDPSKPDDRAAKTLNDDGWYLYMS